MQFVHLKYMNYDQTLKYYFIQMQLMSIWNTWIMMLNIKIIFHSNAINVHLKYINYDQTLK